MGEASAADCVHGPQRLTAREASPSRGARRALGTLPVVGIGASNNYSLDSFCLHSAVAQLSLSVVASHYLQC